MIYVDTQTGRLVIDTESKPSRETIVITRNAVGTQIRYIAKGKTATEEAGILSAKRPSRTFLGFAF